MMPDLRGEGGGWGNVDEGREVVWIYSVSQLAKCGQGGKKKSEIFEDAINGFP